MNESTMNALLTAARQLGMDDQDVHAYPNYSGRCMYGQMTCGLVLNDLASLPVLAAQAVYELVDQTEDYDRPVCDLISDLQRLRNDRMGLNYIVY